MFSFNLSILPSSPKIYLNSLISDAFLVKLKAIQSILCFNPNSRMSFLSFSVTVGISIKHPGKLTFFFSPIEQSFSTLTLIPSDNNSNTLY